MGPAPVSLSAAPMTGRVTYSIRAAWPARYRQLAVPEPPAVLVIDAPWIFRGLRTTCPAVLATVSEALRSLVSLECIAGHRAGQMVAAVATTASAPSRRAERRRRSTPGRTAPVRASAHATRRGYTSRRPNNCRRTRPVDCRAPVRPTLPRDRRRPATPSGSGTPTKPAVPDARQPPACRRRRPIGTAGCLATASPDPQTTPARTTQRHHPPPRKAEKAAPLPTNPASGGTPALEAAASRATSHTAGAARRRPLRSRRSRMPVLWSMTPTTKNSVALNTACSSSIAPARAASRRPAPAGRAG